MTPFMAHPGARWAVWLCLQLPWNWALKDQWNVDLDGVHGCSHVWNHTLNTYIYYIIILYFILYKYAYVCIYIYIYIASTSLFYFICVSRDFSTGKPQIHTVHASEFARKVGRKCKVMLCRQWVFSGYIWVLHWKHVHYKCEGVVSKFRPMVSEFLITFPLGMASNAPFWDKGRQYEIYRVEDFHKKNSEWPTGS